MRTTYLVCYDICDDKRLKKVFKTMRNYGDHLQYSVFECQLTPTDLVRCRTDLAAIIKHSEDQVLFLNEWVEGVFRHSVDTVEGKAQHTRVDAKATKLPTPEEAAEEEIHSRSV